MVDYQKYNVELVYTVPSAPILPHAAKWRNPYFSKGAYNSCGGAPANKVGVLDQAPANGTHPFSNYFNIKNWGPARLLPLGLVCKSPIAWRALHALLNLYATALFIV